MILELITGQICNIHTYLKIIKNSSYNFGVVQFLKNWKFEPSNLVKKVLFYNPKLGKPKNYTILEV